MYVLQITRALEMTYRRFSTAALLVRDLIRDEKIYNSMLSRDVKTRSPILRRSRHIEAGLYEALCWLRLLDVRVTATPVKIEPLMRSARRSRRRRWRRHGRKRGPVRGFDEHYVIWRSLEKLLRDTSKITKKLVT